ncbi:MAG: hypothetical protein CEE38_01195 [Planctomycetes bacterium B3_Pla]|nr:MAG: hypothetical protein CEE38_01195 [Planctomycetes bacterium B3_Pla]
MSNKIDFFQSEQRQLALAAASVSILVDGKLCPDLEPIEIVRSGWPEFSWAKLAYNPAAQTGTLLKAAEDIVNEYAAGKTVCIRQYYNGIPPDAAAFSFPIFHGHIESIDTKLSLDGEIIEIVARDFSANLKRISVYGQRLVKADGSNVFLAGLDTVFNPESKANADPAPIKTAGKTYTAFCAEPSQGVLWGYAEVIDYLLCEYVLTGQLHRPTLGRLKALTENQIVRDLDVTGLSLAEALRRCCDRIGLKFKLMPRLARTGPDQAIVFYKAGTGRTVEFNCQQAGRQFSISKTNIATLHSRKNFYLVTHRYIGQGDFKIYEATFDLLKAWDPNLEDNDYDKFSPSTNPDFYQVKDVYRKWCLNEAGQYSDAPYNQGGAFDFSKIFLNNNFSQRRRRFYPALTTDKLGRSLGYFLQVSFGDSDQNWWQHLHAFNILLDECGIWLSSDQLDTDTWFTSVQGILKFRITASVISDERLIEVVADGPVNSTAPVIEHLTTAPRQFKYRKVSAQSIFAGSTDQTLGIPDEVDDSNALHGFLRHTAATSSNAIEVFDIQTPSLAFDYQTGDIVSTGPDSRDLPACRSDNRSRSWIERVQMDFQKQCTNLKIVRQRKCRL